MKVEVIGNQVDKALQKLRRKLTNEGILQELKNRQYYEPKSVKRRKKKEEAKRRAAMERKFEDRYEDNSFQTKYTRALRRWQDSQIENNEE